MSESCYFIQHDARFQSNILMALLFSASDAPVGLAGSRAPQRFALEAHSDRTVKQSNYHCSPQSIAENRGTTTSRAHPLSIRRAAQPAQLAARFRDERRDARTGHRVLRDRLRVRVVLEHRRAAVQELGPDRGVHDEPHAQGRPVLVRRRSAPAVRRREISERGLPGDRKDRTRGGHGPEHHDRERRARTARAGRRGRRRIPRAVRAAVRRGRRAQRAA